MRHCLCAFALAAAAPAQQIIAATSGLPNPTRVETFGANVLPNFAPVSTQFAGLTISHASYFTTGVSNNLVGGFLTNDFSGPPNTLRIQFASIHTDCSFVYHQIATTGPSTIRIALQGMPIDSFSGTWNQYQPNNWFGFQNTVFDTLEIDFQSDFNFDELALVDPNAARCVLHNGTGINPLGLRCATLPQLGTTWQGAIGMTPNTALTFLVYAPGGLVAPTPLFQGELLVASLPPAVAISGAGSYQMPVPNSAGWVGTVLTFQGFRLDLVGPTAFLVPLNALDLVVGY